MTPFTRRERKERIQIKNTANGNQNEDTDGRGRRVFLKILALGKVYFSYLASYSTSVATVIFTSRAPLL